MDGKSETQRKNATEASHSGDGRPAATDNDLRDSLSCLLEHRRQHLDAAFAVNRLMLDFFETCLRQQVTGWERMVSNASALVAARNGGTEKGGIGAELARSTKLASAQLRELSELAVRTNMRACEIIGDQVSNALAEIGDAISGGHASIARQRVSPASGE
jgi:hypothetical protein